MEGSLFSRFYSIEETTIEGSIHIFWKFYVKELLKTFEENMTKGMLSILEPLF